MIHHWMGWVIAQRKWVLFGVLIWILIGLFSLKNLSIDAVPDITNNQVQIVTRAPRLSAEEVEQYITFPLELACRNLPGQVEVRSISRYGLSVITIVFEEDMPLLEARQMVNEQLMKTDIDPQLGVPEMMPITTGLGEIYQFVLVADASVQSKYAATELRTLMDWQVKRLLAGIPGVIEISTMGGFVKQYEVQLSMADLYRHQVSANQVIDAIQKNHLNAGGGYISQGKEAYYLRMQGRITSLEELAEIPIQGDIRVGDVAKLGYGSAPRFGAMTMDGQGEVVGGIALMLKGENAANVVQAIEERVKKISASLPNGLSIYPFLKRDALVKSTIKTVITNLIEGGLIVIFVLLLFLGDWRAGLLVASVIPLALMFALTLMSLTGLSANLMSLGALDFGIVVDGAVIMVEATLFQFHHLWNGKKLTSEGRHSLIQQSMAQVYGASGFGVAIILLVFVPILFLKGVEGKMFIPMALTMGYTLIGALLLSLTYIPAMAAVIFPNRVVPPLGVANRLAHFLQKSYAPALSMAINKRWLMPLLGVLMFGSGLFLARNMGAEFIPVLEEGDLALQVSLPPGSSLEQTLATTTEIERRLLQQFPEVLHVVSKIGTGEVPTDPMAIEDADVMVILKPRDEWVSAHRREELAAAMKNALEDLPASIEFSQPIQLRFNELMTGAKADISVKIFGESMLVLRQLGENAVDILKPVQGASDIKLEPTAGLNQWIWKPNHAAMARHHVSVADMEQQLQLMRNGVWVGSVYEEERKFDVMIRYRADEQAFSRPEGLLLPTANGQTIPLSEVSTKMAQKGPMQISRENAMRRISIGINVRDRDVASVVKEAEALLKEKLPLPPGYYLQFGGQYENLQHALAALSVAVPIALAIILFLLFLALKEVKEVILIFLAVPMATSGGLWALWLRDMPFSISAGIGFIALFGVAVLNGLVMISAIKHQEEATLAERVRAAAKLRLRPVLMTAFVAALGFVPMAFATGNGAEVQRPLATVVIGGLVTATFLTLMMLPSLYLWVHRVKGIGGTSVLVFAALLSGLPLQAQQPLTQADVLGKLSETAPDLAQSRLDMARWDIQKEDLYRVAPLEAELLFGQVNGPLRDQQWIGRWRIGQPWALPYLRQWVQAGQQWAQSTDRKTHRLLRMEVVLAWGQWSFFDAMSQRTQRYVDQMAKLSEQADQQYRLGALDPHEHENLRQIYLYFIGIQGEFKQQALLSVHRIKRLAGLGPEAVLAPIPFENVQEIRMPPDEPLHPEFIEAETQHKHWLQTQQALIRVRYTPQLSVGGFYQTFNAEPGFYGLAASMSVPLPGQGVQRDLRYHQNEVRQAEVQHQANLRQYALLLQQTREEMQLYVDQLSAYPSDFAGHLQSDFESTLQQYQTGALDLSQLGPHLKLFIDLDLAYFQKIQQFKQAQTTYLYLTK